MGSVFGWPDPNTLGCCSSCEKLEKHSPTARVFQAFLNSRNILSVFGSGHPNTEPIRYLFNIYCIVMSNECLDTGS